MTKSEAIKVLEKYKRYAEGILTDEVLDSIAFDMAIEALSAETEWIPVSERLPKVGQDVLFCDGEWTEEGCLRAEGDWYQFRWSTVRNKEEIIAWMPLPDPYREEREDYDYELATEQMEHDAMYEPTYNPEDGSM